MADENKSHQCKNTPCYCAVLHRIRNAQKKLASIFTDIKEKEDDVEPYAPYLLRGCQLLQQYQMFIKCGFGLYLEASAKDHENLLQEVETFRDQQLCKSVLAASKSA